MRSPRYFPLWLGQLVSNFDNGENPGLSKPLFLRRLDCPPPLSLASVDDEMGDDMPNKNSATIEGSVTAFLRTLSGAKKSASTITAYRTDLLQIARFLAGSVALRRWSGHRRGSPRPHRQLAAPGHGTAGCQGDRVTIQQYGPLRKGGACDRIKI